MKTQSSGYVYAVSNCFKAVGRDIVFAMAVRTTLKRNDSNRGAGMPTIDEPSFAAPASLDAEMSVLGSMLLDNDCIDEVGAILSESHFWEKKHGRIYAWCLRMHEKGKPCDLMLLSKAIERQGQLAELGGLAYLSELIACVPSAANAVYYAEIVRDRWLEREAISVLSVARGDIIEGGSPVDVLPETQQQIDRLLAGELVQGETVTTSLRRILERLERGEPITGMATGFHDLDQWTGGFHPTELIVLAGRTGEGKSTFAVNLCRTIAIEQQVPVCYASYEMSQENLLTNLQCCITKIPTWIVRIGKVDANQYATLSIVSGRIADSPLHFLDAPQLKLEQLETQMRLLVRKHGIKLLIVDHLQMVRTGKTHSSRHDEMGYVCRELRSMALRLNIAVLALSQLNREALKDEGEPKLQYLKESGDIETAAETVLFLYDELWGEKGTSNFHTIKLTIAKQRYGPSGVSALLLFTRDKARFDSQAKETVL